MKYVAITYLYVFAKNVFKRRAVTKFIVREDEKNTRTCARETGEYRSQERHRSIGAGIPEVNIRL